jgi:beta-galactosidase
VGWYRRAFKIPKSDHGRRISVEFDGVFRDSIVWINGHRLGRHASGYTSFRYDLTDYLNYGGENVIAVRADASQYEGWWYEGAGIHRHVWLVKTSSMHVAPNGTFVTSELASAAPGSRSHDRRQRQRREEKDSNRDTGVSPVRGSPARARRPCHGGGSSLVVPGSRAVGSIRNPSLWSPDEPNLYTLRTTLIAAERHRHLRHHLRHSHHALGRPPRVLPQWEAAEDQGHLQPPAVRRRRDCAAGCAARLSG